MHAGDLDADDVQRALGLSTELMAVLRDIDMSLAPGGPVLPDPDEAATALDRLGVGTLDRAEALAARPEPPQQPALWWVLDRLYREQVGKLGRRVPVTGFRGWPALPHGLGAEARYLCVWLYVALLPLVRDYHARHGVPDDVSWATLSRLGQTLVRDRKLYGWGGLGLQWALPLVFRGVYYQGLGRLEYDLHTIPFDNAPSVGGRPAPWRGEPAISVHIPGNGTPLDVGLCDESIARARAFFGSHFAERPTAFMCHTWLLDPQLAEYLPASSNIVRFQQRFNILPDAPGIADRMILRFVFGRAFEGTELPAELLAELPQDTTLQRAYVAHLRSGRHWRNHTGWFRF